MISRNPCAGLWITVSLIAVLVGYPLSRGPALWVFYRGSIPDASTATTAAIYWPMDWLVMNGPEPLRELLFSYSRLWI